jgi:hypothetical protein
VGLRALAGFRNVRPSYCRRFSGVVIRWLGYPETGPGITPIRVDLLKPISGLSYRPLFGLLLVHYCVRVLTASGRLLSTPLLTPASTEVLG